MVRVLTEATIDNLIAASKPLPSNWQSRLRPRTKSQYQYRQRDLNVQDIQANQFRVILRQNIQNPLDFSIIVMFDDTDGSEYRLVRYNGMHPSRHTNNWEKHQGIVSSSFGPDFHIHKATERYQRDGYAIDGYAEPTTSYTDFDSALLEFLRNCGFQQPQNTQLRIV